MVESVINKLFEYYDTVFFEEKVEVDQRGYMGTHYDGLNLDYYLENSVLGIDYLSIEDYFETVANVKYVETQSLFSQYSNKSLEIKQKVIGAVLTLVNSSSYRKEMKKTIMDKSKAFLKRFGLELEDAAGVIQIKNDYKLFEGSYCEIFLFNEQIYKKQLKSQYRTEEAWKKRFKYEYENMLRLAKSPYVLKVFNYDENNDSYLMEKCDCNVYDYLENNPFKDDKLILQVIEELLLGMKDVHEAGIIHRDLHLGNILIKEGHVVLSDFGLSKDTMINHSLKSTSTPKNSHYFIDPIGLHDFTALDKLSDIYSIGKIIDYITGESQLNKKLSFVISKATERNRAKRYTTMDEMIQDVNSSVREISEEEKLQNIEVNIQHGEISKDVEEFVMRLMRQEQLSNYIVRKQLYTFWKVLIQFNEIDQLALLGEIDRTYSEATGYGHFENYDLFAGIAYNVIRNSANMKIQRKAYSILEGCASYRYNASDYLKEINIYYPNILSQE